MVEEVCASKAEDIASDVCLDLFKEVMQEIQDDKCKGIKYRPLNTFHVTDVKYFQNERLGVTRCKIRANVTHRNIHPCHPYQYTGIVQVASKVTLRDGDTWDSEKGKELAYQLAIIKLQEKLARKNKNHNKIAASDIKYALKSLFNTEQEQLRLQGNVNKSRSKFREKA